MNKNNTAECAICLEQREFNNFPFTCSHSVCRSCEIEKPYSLSQQILTCSICGANRHKSYFCECIGRDLTRHTERCARQGLVASGLNVVGFIPCWICGNCDNYMYTLYENDKDFDICLACRTIWLKGHLLATALDTRITNYLISKLKNKRKRSNLTYAEQCTQQGLDISGNYIICDTCDKYAHVIKEKDELYVVCLSCYTIRNSVGSVLAIAFPERINTVYWSLRRKYERKNQDNSYYNMMVKWFNKNN